MIIFKRLGRTSPRSFLAAISASALIASPAAAQTSVISGTVVDVEIGEGLPGANVVISGTARGTATNLDGTYRLEVEPDSYDLVFSFIGYSPKTIRGISVSADQTVTIDVELGADALDLGDVIVEAEAVRSAEGALLASRAKSASVSDAISAEAISRTGSSDAAAAMTKVTGASVVGGKYVYIRGLGERYSNAYLNGSALPTSDPDKKAVQFDIFPANLLDNIVTVKTFTPDKPGSFSGGLVDIATKSFPSQLTLEFSSSFGYNTNTSFDKSFLTYDGGGRDWLAYDDGTRDLPTPLEDPDEIIPSVSRARFDTEAAARLDEASSSFNNVLAPTTTPGPANQSYGLSIGNRAPLGSGTLGYVVGATYSKSASYYDNGRTERWAYAGPGTSQLGPDLLLNDARSKEDVSIGLIANFAYQPAPNHKVALNSLHARNGELETRYQEGQWEELDISDPSSRFLNRTLGWTERKLYSTQMKGDHYLPALARGTVDWALSYGKTRQDEPDRRFVASTERVVGENVVRTMTASGFRDPSRYFRALNEEIWDGGLNFAFPLPERSGFSGKVKFGAAYQTTARSFRERSIEIVTNPSLVFDGDVAAYLSPENMGITGVDTLSDGRIRYSFGHVVRDASKAKNQYDGDRVVAAGYTMVDVLLGHKLRLIAGARLESTLINVASQDTLAAEGEIDKMDLLPSLNAVYHLTNKMNLRIGASRTLARPVFREVAPFESFDFLLGNFIIGNPDLDRSLIWNYDLRWEWFMRPGEIFATSVFYKRLSNPIERAIIGGSNGQVRFQNVPSAEVYGLEFELRSSFDRIASALSNLHLGMNVTFSESTIDIPGIYDETGALVGGELFLRQQTDPAADTRELQGQSPYLINLDLAYENYGAGTYAGLHYNIFGRRLSNISLGGTPDVYERSVPTLDFTFSQALFENWKIKLSAKNLLDPDVKETYGLGDDEYVYQSYTKGRTYSLGASFSL